MKTYVSDAVIKRLPRYRRFLKSLKEQGTDKVSSKQLGEIMDVTASQIRQDLNHFGGFGQQGYGYGVEELGDRLGEILGVDKTYNVAFIGCGRLGQALMNFLIANEPNYKITALCDIRPELQGREIAGVKIDAVEDFNKKLIGGGIDIVILTIPADQVEAVRDLIEKSDVKGVWNFSMTEMVIKGKKVMNMHLSESLQALTYYINHPD
jgi:redox-sensing transcriptional repressor